MAETIKVIEKIHAVKVTLFERQSESSKPEFVETQYWTEDGMFLGFSKHGINGSEIPPFLLQSR